jgi:hypothetical protein
MNGSRQHFAWMISWNVGPSPPPFYLTERALLSILADKHVYLGAPATLYVKVK